MVDGNRLRKEGEQSSKINFWPKIPEKQDSLLNLKSKLSQEHLCVSECIELELNSN